MAKSTLAWAQLPQCVICWQQQGTRVCQPRAPAYTTERCFATYVGVLEGTSLEAILELMAYLVHIMRVIQDFGSLAWVNYDSVFRLRATDRGQPVPVLHLLLWGRPEPEPHT